MNGDLNEIAVKSACESSELRWWENITLLDDKIRYSKIFGTRTLWRSSALICLQCSTTQHYSYSSIVIMKIAFGTMWSITIGLGRMMKRYIDPGDTWIDRGPWAKPLKKRIWLDDRWVLRLAASQTFRSMKYRMQRNLRMNYAHKWREEWRIDYGNVLNQEA